MTNTRAAIRITFPHAQSPVGRGASSADGSCGFGAGFSLGSRFGSAAILGLDVDEAWGFCFSAGLGCDNGFGLGSGFRSGWGPGFGCSVGLGEDAGLGGVPNGRNASQERVSALTCIPYLTPACFALVQLKNLSPFFGLKF